MRKPKGKRLKFNPQTFKNKIYRITRIGIDDAQKLRCYFCGRIIEDENDRVMQNVQTSYFVGRRSFGSWGSRKPFHSACWEAHHKKETRNNLLALLVIALLIGITLAYIIIQFYIL